jgi:nucleoside triphosphate diphosphatase
MSTETPAPGDIGRLLQIMRRLRDPKTGCPWDLEQDFATIAPYTIEEAYEVASAIEAADYAALKDELGDLLLQVVFHSEMASEKGLFHFGNVVEAICEKMIRRHPHVFAKTDIASASGVARAWDEIKRQERAAKAQRTAGLLDDVPAALPALTRAIKLQNRAAEVGFDWPNAVQVTDKIAEETRELAEASDSLPREKVAEEFGDLLFAMANLARHLDLDPEHALRAANAKFIRRFRVIEAGIEAQGKALGEASLAEMEALWDAAKRSERNA